MTPNDKDERRARSPSPQSDYPLDETGTARAPTIVISNPNDGQECPGTLTTTGDDGNSQCKEDGALNRPPPVQPSQSSEHEATVVLTIAICLVVFLMSLDRTILATAVPSITDDFHSLNDVGWYASGFLFASSCMLLPFGKIYTFYSPKWVYVISICIFEVGSLICGVAPSSAVFIVGRAIAGAGSAGISVGAFTLLACVLPLHKRPLYNGILGAVMGVAAVAGPLLGGVFTTLVSWRWCFFINLPIGGVAMLIVFWYLQPVQAVQTGLNVGQQLAQLDLLGELFLIPSTICLLLALQWGGAQYRWSDGRVVAVLVTFSAFLVAFVVVQMRYPDTATIPSRVVKSKSIIAALIFAACMSATMMVVLWCIPLWFQDIKNTTAMRSGINTIPILMSFSLGTAISGIFVGRIGYYTPVAMASSAITATGAGLIWKWNTSTSAREWSGHQILLGFGLGIGFQQSSMAAQTVLMPDDVPIGLALVNVIQQLGGALSVSMGQNLFKASLVHNLGAVLHGSINPQSIVKTGATEFRKFASQRDLPGVLLVYNSALQQAFLLGLITATISALGSCLLEWRSVKGDQGPRRQSAVGTV
ncbi:Putative major facilitator superfamily, MFS transporter superfamily [Septoria linicola]|uniref:Major facilitator superfamily, MFS transporter superfamily n=1 Tax=Septoria linicola TaxID=215465 RepID=A0A9Q9B120_9PEZI|nr:Putative major facilitator superfamily, MFS transporter superfamily [Septoria linicola]